MCAFRLFCLALTAGSLRLAVLEDEEEERRELEEMKHKGKRRKISWMIEGLITWPVAHLDETSVYLNASLFCLCLSLRLGIKEDEEEMRMEEEEMKRKLAMKAKRRKTWCWTLFAWLVWSKVSYIEQAQHSFCAILQLMLFISNYQNRGSVLHYQEPIFNSWALENVIYCVSLMPFFYIIGNDHEITINRTESTSALVYVQDFKSVLFY